jgi:hypothetical protein
VVEAGGNLIIEALKMETVEAVEAVEAVDSAGRLG